MSRTDALQTSPVAPPSIALAKMAWRLAKWRRYESRGMEFIFTDGPLERYMCSPNGSGAYAEYWRIIDRISAGEAP